MKTLLLILAALAIAPPIFAEELSNKDNVVNTDPDNKALIEAIARARKSLPLFFTHVLDKNGRALADASIKVAFPVSGGGAENIWVIRFRCLDDTHFEGELANDPVHINGRFGDRVQFEEAQIIDWDFSVEGDGLYGHYTTRILLGQLEKDAANALRAMLSPDPIPDGWK